MLKRLRAGLPSDITILTGAASAATAVFLAQALVLALYAGVVLDVPVPLNPIPLLLALVLTAALMTTTAALVSALTRSSDAAMITTFPTVAFFLVTPGILVSRGVLPQAVEDVFWYSPLGPFREVMLIGWIGVDDAQGFLGSLVAALPGIGVMAAWLALTALAVQRYFHWEPRHRG
jgi:ABC-2 type transport system permease protein